MEQFYTNWEHEAKEAWRKIVIYKDEASRYKKECEGKEKEIAELKAKINELTMDNMTHEYNQAEGEKFAPEMNRQLVAHHLKNIREGGYYPSGDYWFQGELYWDDDAIYELSK